MNLNPNYFLAGYLDKTAGVEEIPSYRDAVGSRKCGNCESFQNNGRCQQYDAAVSASKVCDTWTGKNKEEVVENQEKVETSDAGDTVT